MSNDIPRRARADLYVPAETAIREAMLAVESMGADVRLTDAVVLLGKAKDAVADYVDAKPLSRERTQEILGSEAPVPVKLLRGVGLGVVHVCMAQSDESDIGSTSAEVGE